MSGCLIAARYRIPNFSVGHLEIEVFERIIKLTY